MKGKAMLFAAGVAVLMMGCGNNKQDRIKSVRITSSLPALNPEGILTVFNDTLNIFYYKNLIMYQIPVVKSRSKGTINKAGDLINESLVNIEISHKYLVYRKGDPIGLLYDSISHKNGARTSVDSFLTSNTITNFEAFYKKKRTNDSLLGTYKIGSNNIFVEKYIPKKSLDPSYSDSTYLYYDSNLNFVDFSFSREMDSIGNAKLYEVKIIYNPKPQSTSAYMKAGREIIFKLEKTEPGDLAEILNLFKQVP